MKSTRLQGLLGTALTAAVLIGAAPIVRATAADDGRRSGNRDAGALAGTWFVQAGLVDCTTRTPLGKPFTSLLTFTEDGTMTGTTANPAFAVGQRTPDHGVWKQKTSHLYRASSVALIAFETLPVPPASPGFEAGMQTLVQTIELTDADHFTSDAVTEFFDTSGNKYRSACAGAVAQRWK